jgi:NAD(P)-dependent dehydrogenase (short-subunit alcohol dehydrogenase family)
MDKKVILITGASGGIGRELASFFNDDKYHLVLHHFKNSIDFPENENTTIIKADLTLSNEIDHLVEVVLSKFGKVDVIINNSGISRNAVTWKTTDQDWDETILVNLTAPFKICRAFLPSMRKNNNGVIINVSSVVGQIGVPGTAAYAASKAGLIGLTKSMSKEVAVNNIRVNAISLGYFEKGMIANVPDDITKEIVELIPMKKLGEVKNICQTIAWLIHEDADYITGQVINLNGGLFS